MKNALICELCEEFVCKNICYVSIIFTSDDWWLENRMSVFDRGSGKRIVYVDNALVLFVLK